MNKSIFSSKSIIIPALILSGTINTAKSQENKAINIIHILADDVAYDDLSCYGATDIKTPNLDILASQGVRFTNYYAAHGTCTPSRASILTGRYAPRVNNNTGLTVLFPGGKEGLDPKKEITIAQLLKSKKYATGMFGKWHLGSMKKYLPIQQGFDEFLGIPYCNDHGPERNGGTGSKNFPTIPLIKNNKVIQLCDNNNLAELPALFVRATCKFISKNSKANKPFFVQYSNIETHTPWFLPKGFDIANKNNKYKNAVEYFDRTVGIIVKLVKKLGIEKNTIIVFSTDNGPLIKRYPELEDCYGTYAKIDTCRKHILRGGKYQSRHEGGVRVPCIIKWTGKIKPGQVKNQICAGFDLFSTFANIAQAKIPTDRVIDGKNLMPLMLNKDNKIRDTFYGFEPHGMLMSVRYKNWKLTIPSKKTYGIKATTEYALYNLDVDLSESKNIADKHIDITNKLIKMAEKAKYNIRHDIEL